MLDRKSLPLFFLLVFVFSVPFWAADFLVPQQLLPGLPLSAMGVVSVVAAAAVCSHRDSGRAGLGQLFARCLETALPRAAVWYLPAFLLFPCIMTLSFALARLSGTAIPLPQTAVVSAVLMFVAFFVAALCEELGWTGYATDPLQQRFGALGASLLLGAVWAIWHFIPLIQVHRTVEFIAWWTLATIAQRIIIVWLYNNTANSVFVAVLLHATGNLSWQLYPINGSFYDPRTTGLITAAVALLVIVVFGPKSLSWRSAKTSVK